MGLCQVGCHAGVEAKEKLYNKKVQLFQKKYFKKKSPTPIGHPLSSFVFSIDDKMKERINYLLRQYFYNTSTRPELDELFATIRSAKYDEDLAVLIKELYEELKRQDPSLTYVDHNGELLDFSEFAAESDRRSSDQPRKPSGRTLKIYVGMAACVAMLLLGFFYGQQSKEHKPEEHVRIINSVAKDENKVLILDDGSKVWINSSSRLEYPQQFKKGQPREVTLIGEAYFEVERAEDWPFVVHTGDIQTKVLGTKFNIKAYPGMKDILVTVKSGKVMVSKQSEILATLVKNQELRVPLVPTAIIPAIKGKELKNKIAGSWTEGYLEYEDESISSIIADLERFYRLSIQLQHTSLGDKVITMSVLKDSDPSYVLEILTTLTDTDFKKEGNNYIIF